MNSASQNRCPIHRPTVPRINPARENAIAAFLTTKPDLFAKNIDAVVFREEDFSTFFQENKVAAVTACPLDG
ncbi:MAG TPA: hypothetical protein VJR91_13420 [Burkholderia sp.]|nr:hypothetical protein [Burkholderia sp.]